MYPGGYRDPAQRTEAQPGAHERHAARDRGQRPERETDLRIGLVLGALTAIAGGMALVCARLGFCP
ncbi:MAG: hypothetical protein EBU54_17020, partial [Mycobacteriaceae bacterium]|nr:hypothetical protein [Mycobacteriaceae bacterium]